MRCKRLVMNSVADTKKLYYLTISSIKISIMRIEDWELDLDHFNEKMEEKYISLDIPLATFLSAAR